MTNLQKYHWVLPIKRKGTLLQKLLNNIGVQDENIDEFLNPKLEIIFNQDNLFDSSQAAKLIIDNKDKKFVIHGDFDVDGIVSTSILWDFLYRKLNINCIPIIPNRFNEGYGLSEESISRAKEQNADLIIAVDCGIKDIEIINRNKDIDFIITDHHTFPTNDEGEKSSPMAKNLLAIVHPQHPLSKNEFSDICGASVVFKLICSINDLTGNKHDISEYIDLVALATVTDIMPLVNENRALVKHGIEFLKKSKSVGINSLLKTLGLEKEDLKPYHLGYVIGPHFNAAGRIKEAIEGVRLLSTKNTQTADLISKQLSELNKERQKITLDLIEIASDSIEPTNKIIIVHGEEWPEGIIGLVAGKLCEKYNRPAIVMSITNDVVKGSARSISKYNISSALKRAEKYLIKYGGHKQAAGFSLYKKNLKKFIKFMEIDASKNLTDEDLIPELKLTAEISLADIDPEFVDILEMLEPHGLGNEKPNFLIKNLNVIENRVIGKADKHSKLTLNSGNRNIQALGFNQRETLKSIEIGDMIDVVAYVSKNAWNGNTYLQLEIKDICRSIIKE